MRLGVPVTISMLAIAALVGCTEEEAGPEPLRSVRSVIVSPTVENETITQTGEIVARRDVPLGFRLGGRIAARPAEIGTTVAAGDLLATLDPRDLDSQLRIASAEVEGALAALSVAEAHADRQTQLLERDIVSKAAVEAAEADRQTAAARLSAAKAQLAAAEDQRSYADLRATEAGIITAVLAQPGEVVGPGQPVVRIAAAGEREAAFNVSERLAAGAEPGLPVTVSLISDPSVAVGGVLREVSPTADPVTRTYRVLVSLPGEARGMPFGAAVQGSVTFGASGLVSLPRSALTSQDDAPAVFVVTEEGTLSRRPVTVARYEDDRVIVAQGLNDGDRVVTAGVSKLRPDQAVLVTEDQQ